MIIKRIPAGVYAANCYLLMDDNTLETAVIDPGGDVDDIIKAIENLQAKVRYILLTHGHTDHTGGVQDLKDKYNVPVCISEKDEQMIKNGEYIYGPLINGGNADIHLKHGDVLKIGNLNLKCIETPGHTPGGMCFLVENVVFTGDTLFAGSIGRTDFAGGDYDTIIRSIKNNLIVLDEDTKVLPGHGPESSIKREKIHNPFL